MVMRPGYPSAPGVIRKVSDNALKHNGPAKRDPSGSMSDPVPMPPSPPGSRVAGSFPRASRTLFLSRTVRPLPTKPSDAS